MAQLLFKDVQVAIGSEDEVGVLAFLDGRLCAVLVRLDGRFHGAAQGRWHLEAGFGECDARPDSFADLQEASRWIGRRTGLSMTEADQAAAAKT